MAKKKQLVLWGQHAVAKELGTSFPNNIYTVKGLPKPRYGPDLEELADPDPEFLMPRRLWDADEIRVFARERQGAKFARTK